MAFLIGHIMYIVSNYKIRNPNAFVDASLIIKIVLGILAVVAMTLFVVQVFYYFFAKKSEGKVIVIVGVYGIFLLAMIISSFMTYNSYQDLSNWQFWMRVIGSLMFMISDSARVFEMVHERYNRLFVACFIIVTYDLTQLLILKGNQFKSGLFQIHLPDSDGNSII